MGKDGRTHRGVNLCSVLTQVLPHLTLRRRPGLGMRPLLSQASPAPLCPNCRLPVSPAGPCTTRFLPLSLLCAPLAWPSGHFPLREGGSALECSFPVRPSPAPSVVPRGSWPWVKTPCCWLAGDVLHQACFSKSCSPSLGRVPPARRKETLRFLLLCLPSLCVSFTPPRSPLPLDTEGWRFLPHERFFPTPTG